MKAGWSQIFSTALSPGGLTGARGPLNRGLGQSGVHGVQKVPHTRAGGPRPELCVWSLQEGGGLWGETGEAEDTAHLHDWTTLVIDTGYRESGSLRKRGLYAPHVQERKMILNIMIRDT